MKKSFPASIRYVMTDCFERGAMGRVKENAILAVSFGFSDIYLELYEHKHSN